MFHHESGRSLFRGHFFTNRLHQSKSVKASYLKVTKKITKLQQRRADIWVDSFYLAKTDTEELAWQQPFLDNIITAHRKHMLVSALNF